MKILEATKMRFLGQILRMHCSQRNSQRLPGTECFMWVGNYKARTNIVIWSFHEKKGTREHPDDWNDPH